MFVCLFVFVWKGLIGKNTQYMAFRGRAHPTVQTYRLGVSSPLPSPTALFDTILANLRCACAPLCVCEVCAEKFSLSLSLSVCVCVCVDRADELRELARQFEMIDIQGDRALQTHTHTSLSSSLPPSLSLSLSLPLCVCADDHFAAFVYQMADALDSGQVNQPPTHTHTHTQMCSYQVSLPSYLSYEDVKRIAFDVYRAAAR